MEDPLARIRDFNKKLSDLERSRIRKEEALESARNSIDKIEALWKTKFNVESYDEAMILLSSYKDSLESKIKEISTLLEKIDT